MYYAIAAGFIAVLAFGLLGLYVAIQTGRSEAEGFWLGLLFGPVGVIVAALLPRSAPAPLTDMDEDEDGKATKYLRTLK